MLAAFQGGLGGGGNRGFKNGEFLQEGAGMEDEYAAVPEEVIVFQVSFGRAFVWFFKKRADVKSPFELL